MSDPDDLPLERTPGSSTSPKGSASGGRPPIARIAIAVLILLLLGVGWWWMSSRRQAQAPATNAVAATDAPVAPPPTPAVDLPALDQMDPFLRALLGALSTRPELASWLASDDLIRQLAAAIDKASRGESPSRDFKQFKPAAAFSTVQRGTRHAINPASYRRYNALVDGVTAVDASAVARAYRTIRPRLNDAYRAMGHPTGDVDVAVDAALTILLDTPVLKDPVYVVEGSGVRWKYADPKIEALYGSQRQLLRMGPDHVDALLVWLRALQGSLQTK